LRDRTLRGYNLEKVNTFRKIGGPKVLTTLPDLLAYGALANGRERRPGAAQKLFDK
jgi:hypothetical protein